MCRSKEIYGNDDSSYLCRQPVCVCTAAAAQSRCAALHRRLVSGRLSVEQVDTLWTCLAHDRQYSDDLFSWMLSQVRGKDQHALGMDSLR